jgi:hypothetical protein
MINIAILGYGELVLVWRRYVARIMIQFADVQAMASISRRFLTFGNFPKTLMLIALHITLTT